MVPKGDSYYLSFTNFEQVQFDSVDSSLWNIENSGIKKITDLVVREDDSEMEDDMDIPTYQISIHTMNTYETNQERYFIISPELFN